MNKIKLAYVRFCNKNKRIKKKRIKILLDKGVEDIFNNIKSTTNDYRSAVHNFLVIYKSYKACNHKFLLYMLNGNYISLRAMKNRWDFAKSIYKNYKEKLKELKK